MKNNYNKYTNYENFTNQKELEDNKKFFKILSDMKTLNYEEKVEYIKNKWGEVQEKKEIFYGTKCKLTITVDNNGIYHMEFAFENIPKNIFDEFDSEIINDLYNNIKDKVYEEHPELKDTDIDSSIKTDNEYLNMYNNVHINIKNKN